MAENGWCGGRPAELLRRIDGALLPALGGLGRFQKRLLLLTWIPALLIGFSSFSDSFLLTQPDHNQQNQRNQQCDNTSSTSNTSCVCLEERELINGLEQNVVTKWNLVCDSAWIVHIAKFSLLVGSILGYLVLGVLADWFGRHPVLILSVFFTLVFGVAVAFSVNVPMFGTLRFFEGFCLAGITLALYALRIELCLPGWRFSVTMVSNFVVLAGQLLMPGVAVLCRDWQVLQVVIISPLLLMMTYIWIFPESLRWLLATQQLRQSRWIMQQTAEKNGVRLEPEMEELMAELGDAPQGQSKRTCIVRMVGTRTLWKNIVVLCVNSLTGYGIHHCFARSMMDQETDAATMFHNFYADYYTMGGIAVASCVALCPAVSVMGRRGGLLMFMIITALASLLQLGLLNLLGKYSVQLNIERSDTLKSNFSVAFSIIGMFSSHAVSNLSIFFCAEITPTVIRGGGLGLVLASAGFGMLTAPIMELHNQKGYFLHHIIFACCTLICIICILLLPETRDEPLPEMLTDAENYTRRPLLPHRPAEQLRLLTKPPPDSTASSLLDLPVITDTPTRQVFGVEAEEAESEDPEALPNISALIDKQSVCAASAPPTSGRVTAPSLAELQACPDGVLLHIVESPEEVGGSQEEVGGSQMNSWYQEEVGGSQEGLGVSQDGLGVSQEEVGGSQEDVGGSQMDSGSQEEVGVSQERLGVSQEEVGGSQEEVGGSQMEVGGSQEEVGGSQEEVGGSREEMGGSQVETDSAALVTPHSTADAPPTEAPANCQTQAPPPASSGHSPAAPPRSQTSDPRGVEPSGTLQGGAEDTPS